MSDRELYTDDGEKIFDETRPIILNGIGHFATRSDLLERAIVVTLPEIDKSKRLDETTFWQNFKEAQPRLLGATLDAASCALRRIDSVRLVAPPRMADFAKWVTAAEEALGWEEGEFLRAYEKNLTRSGSIALEADPLGQAVLQFMGGRRPWEGPAKKLLDELKECVDTDVIHQAGFPKSSNSLSSKLMRLETSLADEGIKVTRGKGKERFIRLEGDDADDPPTIEKGGSSKGSD